MPNDTAPAWDGVPPNPEKDGWHWLEWMDYCGTKPTGIFEQFKWERDGWWDRTTHRSARYWKCWRYLGPCLTPAEATTRERAAAAAAAEAMREAAAGLFAFGVEPIDPQGAIRALPIPADASAALAEVVRKAVEREREACAALRKAAEHARRAMCRAVAPDSEYTDALDALDAAIFARSTEGTP